MRHPRIALLTALVALTLGSSAVSANTDIALVNNQVGVALGVNSLHYQEGSRSVSPNGDLAGVENGNLGGGFVHATRQGPVFGVADVYVTAELQATNGHTVYNRLVQTGSVKTPVQTSSGATVNDFVIRVGKSFSIGNDAQITPLFGLGEHFWVRDIPSHFGYLEIYTHHYVEAGVLAQYAFAPKLVGSAQLTMGTVYNTEFKGDISANHRYALGAASQGSLKLGLDYAMNSRWHLTVNYFQSQFQYQESRVAYDFQVPSSTTTSKQLYFGLARSF